MTDLLLRVNGIQAAFGFEFGLDSLVPTKVGPVIPTGRPTYLTRWSNGGTARSSGTH